jgi:hypothetical protein
MGFLQVRKTGEFWKMTLNRVCLVYFKVLIINTICLYFLILMHRNLHNTLKSFALHLNICPMRAAFTFFPVKKSKQKRPVQKKAIAKHRAFPSQNAFSIALIIISLILTFYEGDRRTFDSSFTIACFLNDIPDL